jgi:hypothetical protein
MDSLAPIHSQADIRATEFSSYGPTDDGRIKPDVVAHGDDLISPVPPDRCELKAPCLPGSIGPGELQEYHRSSGTSMASPVAAGIGALLNEVATKSAEFGRALYSDEMKAVLIHTALSDNERMAPNYTVGWGMIQADMAGALVTGDIGRLCSVEVEEGRPIQLTSSWKMNSLGRVTAAWLDRVGTAADWETAKINNRSSQLVDDVDIVLRSPSNREYASWRLDPRSPRLPASNSEKGRNTVDNVERIDVPALEFEKGQWTLLISLHSRTLKRLAPTRVSIGVYGFEQICGVG